MKSMQMSGSEEEEKQKQHQNNRKDKPLTKDKLTGLLWYRSWGCTLHSLHDSVLVCVCVCVCVCDRERDWEGERKGEKERDRDKERDTHSGKETETARYRDRQTFKERLRKTDRMTDKRLRVRKRDREKVLIERYDFTLLMSSLQQLALVRACCMSCVHCPTAPEHRLSNLALEHKHTNLHPCYITEVCFRLIWALQSSQHTLAHTQTRAHTL